MSALSDKIRRRREIRVPIGRHTFIARRPTELEMIHLAAAKDLRAIIVHVTGWEDVTEADILTGGDPHPLAFDPDVCFEWLSDRTDLLGPITDAVFNAYRAYRESLEAAEKN